MPNIWALSWILQNAQTHNIRNNKYTINAKIRNLCNAVRYVFLNNAESKVFVLLVKGALIAAIQ